MSFTQAVRSLQNVMKNIHTIILTKAVSRFIYSKCCILEEELKTMIAAARSLEAQVEKVRRAWSTFPDAALRPRTKAVEWRKTAFQPGFFQR